ncbi:MAG TPA: efflux RND transporter periplasmic adaptor subunit [Bacteroidota bacterium]|nr:efflux RND transporter periplasmic adaptor subunit [Bacteroidota bacterium]
MVQQSKKKSKKKIIIFSILAAVLAVLALLVVLGSKNEPVIPVQVEKVTSRTVTQTVLSTGKIYPEIQVLISPEVSGEIIELPVKEGMKVAKGDLLVRIKPDIYIAAKDRADAGLKSAQANLTQGESEYNRAKELFLKGLISESELEAAKTTYETRRAFYDQAKASVDQMAEDLRKTTVYAPMAGIVSGLQVELGERVLGTAQFQGTQVMTVADLSHMESRVDVGENDIVLISIGDTARIEVDAITDRKLTGIVYEIGNAAKTRGLGTQEEVTNFEVKIRIVDTEPRLRPGMSMNATIETDTRPDVLTVPIQSVTVRMPGMDGMEEEKMGEGDGEDETGGLSAVNRPKKKKAEKPKEIVFVVEGNAAKSYEIRRGISDDAYTEIVSGLNKDQEVVSGSYKAINRELKEGSKVRIETEKKKDRPGTP